MHMATPTIVRQTKDYILVKIPLPPKEDLPFPATKKANGKMATAERRGWKRIQEAERDVREGRVITAPSIDEALKKYAKRQWN